MLELKNVNNIVRFKAFIRLLSNYKVCYFNAKHSILLILSSMYNETLAKGVSVYKPCVAFVVIHEI